MKVLLINHFPLEGSGSGTYTKNIALHLQKRGHEVVRRLPGKPAVFAAARHQDVSCAVFKEQAAEERAPL